MENIIKINNLSLSYGKGLDQKKALQGIDLSLSKGEICGFLGPNGAGKTTLIKTMLGLLKPDSGSVLLFGKEPAAALNRQTIGYMPETANYYWYLTPKELLVFYAKLFKIKPDIYIPRIDHLLKIVGLSENKDKLMQTFSKGMLQKISFAQCLINDPQLLILDEPTSGFDPIARMNMRKILLDLKSKGKTIFFSSHELSEAEIISDKVVILKNGKILKQTAPRQIMNEKGDSVNLETYFFDLVKNE